MILEPFSPCLIKRKKSYCVSVLIIWRVYLRTTCNRILLVAKFDPNFIYVAVFQKLKRQVLHCSFLFLKHFGKSRKARSHPGSQNILHRYFEEQNAVYCSICIVLPFKFCSLSGFQSKFFVVIVTEF